MSTGVSRGSRTRSTSPRAPGRPADLPVDPIAVIDIGSNSLRMTIARQRTHGYLEIIAEPRATLRLARAVDADGGLSPETLARTLVVLEDFMAVAAREGVGLVRAVGTSALRDAANSDALADAVRERWDLEIEVIDGPTESRRAALGAIYGLPVESGLVVDLGGGSLQIARFDGRAVGEGWSFPLGTLRLTDRFLSGDPPPPEELEALRLHVRAELVSAGVPRLHPHEQLVGTGGTVRNLATVSRRGRRYPIARVHGYLLTSRRLRRVQDRLAAVTVEERRQMDLNADRADIIVAGAAALVATLEHARAPSMLVSGQGLREGVARGSLPLPPPPTVRAASVDALARRFASWDEDRARRRLALADELLRLLDPGADEPWRESVEHAARLLDVGSAIDVYRRARATADVVLRADLTGFAHSDVARLAGVIRVAHRAGTEARVLRPLLGPDDDEALQRAGAILALAEELIARVPEDAHPNALLRMGEGELCVGLPNGRNWQPDGIAARIEQVFGLRLTVAGTS